MSLCLFLSTHFHTASGLTLSLFLFQLGWVPHLASQSPSCPGFEGPLLFLIISFCFIPLISLSLLSLSPLSTYFMCILTMFSLLYLFKGKNLGMTSVPVQSRCCHPTKRVGVKHRHRHSLPERWHHTKANGSRETWIYVCCHPHM